MKYHLQKHDKTVNLFHIYMIFLESIPSSKKQDITSSQQAEQWS